VTCAVDTVSSLQATLVTKPVTLLTSLIAFPAIALHQLQKSIGLRRLSFEGFQNIGAALDQMNSPTDEQAALIKLTLEGKRFSSPDR